MATTKECKCVTIEIYGDNLVFRNWSGTLVYEIGNAVDCESQGDSFAVNLPMKMREGYKFAGCEVSVPVGSINFTAIPTYTGSPGTGYFNLHLSMNNILQYDKIRILLKYEQGKHGCHSVSVMGTPPADINISAVDPACIPEGDSVSVSVSNIKTGHIFKGFEVIKPYSPEYDKRLFNTFYISAIYDDYVLKAIFDDDPIDICNEISVDILNYGKNLSNIQSLTGKIVIKNDEDDVASGTVSYYAVGDNPAGRSILKSDAVTLPAGMEAVIPFSFDTRSFSQFTDPAFGSKVIAILEVDAESAACFSSISVRDVKYLDLTQRPCDIYGKVTGPCRNATSVVPSHVRITGPNDPAQGTTMVFRSHQPELCSFYGIVCKKTEIDAKGNATERWSLIVNPDGGPWSTINFGAIYMEGTCTYYAFCALPPSKYGVDIYSMSSAQLEDWIMNELGG
ncbi:MAG: hypothetical protein BWY47_00052 [Bacteroidetes bacterium ADurb.Bin302]|nr:MAG: hypothetical protein BWY47_00052 [Bacteroidetes bacterium ADurb.Bin302]